MCATAAVTRILLDSNKSFSIAGKTAENMRLLLEEPALVQGKTVGDKSTFMLLPKTVFGLSTDLDTFGRIGNNFETNGDPLVIDVDWTQRTFSMSGTIKNLQKTAAITLSLAGRLANQPPRADAGLDQTPECTSPNGTLVALSASGSTDPDGVNDIASYLWDWQLGGVHSTSAGVNLSVIVPLGTTPFSLTVRDKEGASDGDGVNIESRDRTPPILTLGQPAPDCLWPPNHRFVLYNLGTNLPFTVKDTCDASPKVEIASVTSNQAPDFTFGKSALCLGSERAGSGERDYTITIVATDASNNTTTKTVVVRVPHDQSNDCPKVDPARIVDSTDPRCTKN
jgi:hypothetical protein